MFDITNITKIGKSAKKGKTGVKMENRIEFGLISLLIGIIFVPNLVLADGGIFISDYLQHVYLPSQKAAIFWDGENEIMILSTRISTDDLTDMAWIIPIPSRTKPEIEKGDIQIFYDLADLFTPPRKPKAWGRGAESLKSEIQVIEIKKVDIYDITTLKATNATSLINWLNEHGYVVPKTTIPILQDYCDRDDFYFIANKINLANKYKDLSITQRDRECATRIYIPFIYPLEEEINYDIQRQLKYIKECKNASFEAVKVLAELKQGTATPLKFTFQPEKAFYPLKISSINDGETDINVYVFSETPVKDRQNTLSISKMVKISEYWRNKFNLTNENYVTLLEYNGNLKNLNKDSLFESTNYNYNLDPTYVSLEEEILYSISSFILFIISFSYVLTFSYVLIMFVFGYLIKKSSERIKNKKFYYLSLFISFVILLIGPLVIIGVKIVLPLTPALCIGLLDGFYAGCKNSKKWIWITILLALTILYSIFIMFIW